MMNFRLKYYGLWFFALMLVGGAGRSTSAEPVFSFSNYSEPETLDPALATGFPEYKIFLGIFEGLTTLDGKTLEVQPGVAKSWQITDGGTKYTFLIRDDAKWSNGRRVVAGDFVYSWKRLLEPKFAAPFARHLFYVKGAEAFNHGDNKDFNSVAVRAISDDVLEVQLIHPTPYFLFLCSFYALMPVPQETIEKYQGAAWTKPNNIVTNGPYTLKEWLPRQRVVLEKSTSYWDSKNVSLQKIIIYPTESNETAYNLYVAGKIDWTGQTSLPDKSLMALRKRQDYHEPLRLGINFLRLNIEKKPLNNLDVRKALHLAIDREALVTQVTKSGELAALSLTPDLLSNYQAPKAPGFNPAKAAYHLNKAGFCALGYQNPKCKPFPAMSILYNRDERHKAVLQAVIGMWKHYLGIQTISLRSREWKNYLQEQRQSQYEISRSGWIADYPDAVSFIELFMKGGSNNSTGWANTKYEELVQASRFEINPETRAKALQAAEEILLNDLPILPLYYFTTPFLLSPKVGGLYENILDVHPYKGIFIKGDTATAPEKGPEKTQ